MGDQRNPAYTIRILMQKKIERLLTEGPWSRSMLAKLRRGIGKQPGELPELFEIVLSDMPEELYGKGDGPSYSVWSIYTAVTLFALHQQGKEHPMSMSGKTEGQTFGNSLGAAVGELVKLEVKQDEEREPAIKRRFDAVCTANEFTELVNHARGLIQLLRVGDIKLDYPRFAEDLYWYQFDDVRNRIRLRWGEDYYRIAHSYTQNGDGGVFNEQ